jgi:CRP/FNR family cyclic AMP-dependent transcriptional regulator
VVSIEQLKDIPLFRGLSRQELEDVAAYLTLREYAKGETIFKENTDGEQKLYIIRQGRICISKMVQEGEQQNLTLLKDGEFFGEISLLDGKPHSASATALKDSSVFTLSREQFEALLAKDVPGGYQLMHNICLTICQLLRQMDEKFIDMIKFVWEFGAKT